MRKNNLQYVEAELARAKEMYNAGGDVREMLKILKNARGHILNTIDFFEMEAFQKANYTKSQIEGDTDEKI